jgi:hypothetical protein
LVVHPASVVALRGASVSFRAAIVDDAGHRLRAATVAPLAVGDALGDRVATVRAGDGLTASVPLHVVNSIASLAIVPDDPNPAPNTQLTLALQALDARGLPVAIDGVAARWSLPGGTVVAPQLVYDSAHGNATVAVTLGGARAQTRVLVGQHTVAVPYPETDLRYDFTGTARTALVPTIVPFPDAPLTLALDVLGDGNGVPLRAAFLNRFRERVVVTLAAHVDWRGWQRVTVRLPPGLNPPVVLVALYVVPSLGGLPVRASGELHFRNLSVVVPGVS